MAREVVTWLGVLQHICSTKFPSNPPTQNVTYVQYTLYIVTIYAQLDYVLSNFLNVSACTPSESNISKHDLRGRASDQMIQLILQLTHLGELFITLLLVWTSSYNR